MPPRFLIAVDYGTTFTGVSWVLTEGRDPTLDNINLVDTWPTANATTKALKVPSMITYCPNSGSQWGYGIGDGAYVLRWTKLQLETPTRHEALKRLKHTLEETRLLAFNVREDLEGAKIPFHLACTTEQIVTEYLTHVARVVEDDIKRHRDARNLEEFPIDLMITHPAKWQLRARNITFRAVNEAFRSVFPRMRDLPGHVRMGTEPEASAQYIMSLAVRTRLGSLRRARIFMSTNALGECFIIVDAGGGTVDLVSYQVDQSSPNFSVTRITEPAGGPFGSTRVDQHLLKRFLRERLSEQDYNFLVNEDRQNRRHGSGPHAMFTSSQHKLIEKFQTIKHKFSGAPQQDFLVLPSNLGQDENPLRGPIGNVRITETDLETMFEDSVSGVLTLLLQQLTQIRQLKGLMPKCVFLSGGFSASPYLRKRIETLCTLRRISVLRAWENADDVNIDPTTDETGWADVARGAALMGLGIGCPAPPICIECPVYIGVLVAVDFKNYEHRDAQLYTDKFDRKLRARNHIKWMAAKGDLITREEGINNSLTITRKVIEDARLTGSIDVVISRMGGHEEIPEGK
ncbi:hypothetical protein QBC47DRAFT_444660 [Echria macrotheca]|uniref:Actin-like ATPase domain-containing protein n=1 Tax=Echria macrotheca TaxID=438768 RepID=A0AAJ0BGD4_9PEZI|nr:hypothetical protein QBC47DRAFT_444660 [Echria macrotheca]